MRLARMTLGTVLWWLWTTKKLFMDLQQSNILRNPLLEISTPIPWTCFKEPVSLLFPQFRVSHWMRYLNIILFPKLRHLFTLLLIYYGKYEFITNFVLTIVWHLTCCFCVVFTCKPCISELCKLTPNSLNCSRFCFHFLNYLFTSLVQTLLES
jgi:hypothetical protein